MAVEVLERISSPRGYSFSPYCSLYLPFHNGRCQGHGQELLTNTGFEVGDPPTDWIKVGVGATWERSNEQTYRGTYSGKLTRAGTDCWVQQYYAEYAKYKGLQFTAQSQAYATVASRARLQLYDGVGWTYSSWHSGVAGWELLPTTLTMATTAGYIRVLLRLDTGDTSAYFDEASLKINNIFMSHDHYGHPVQVLGAKWTPQGYWFDGVDDVIVVPDHTAIQNIFDSPGGTIVAWINPASIGENSYGRICDKGNVFIRLHSDLAGTCKLDFVQSFSTLYGEWRTTEYVITYNKPQMVSISYNNSSVTNDPVICLDGSPVAITETSTPIGTRSSDVPSALYIGNNTSIDYTFNGYINALWAFKGKMLSPIELQRIFLATKGRFGR